MPQTLAELRAQFSRAGRLEWIGSRPAKGADIKIVTQAEVDPDWGLGDDHRTRGDRQVTLVQAEHLPVIAQLCGVDSVKPEQLRRNLVVSGISVWGLRDREFSIGNVRLLGTGHCHPCSRMEETLGAGGYNAVRGHGGITARVITSGAIRIGDEVVAPRS